MGSNIKGLEPFALTTLTLVSGDASGSQVSELEEHASGPCLGCHFPTDVLVTVELPSDMGCLSFIFAKREAAKPKLWVCHGVPVPCHVDLHTDFASGGSQIRSQSVHEKFFALQQSVYRGLNM